MTKRPNRQTAARALVAIDEILAGLRDGRESDIATARAILGQMAARGNVHQLAALMMAIQTQAEFEVYRTTRGL